MHFYRISETTSETVTETRESLVWADTEEDAWDKFHDDVTLWQSEWDIDEEEHWDESDIVEIEVSQVASEYGNDCLEQGKKEAIEAIEHALKVAEVRE